jgi:hypothetical protein
VSLDAGQFRQRREPGSREDVKTVRGDKDALARLLFQAGTACFSAAVVIPRKAPA